MLKNYFTSRDPHHDMSGEGCQVNVIYRVKQAFHNVQARHTCFLEFARSCCVLPALQYSTSHKCLRKQNTNMSKNKHAKTCQYTTWQK